jgi:hypothetical protein
MERSVDITVGCPLCGEEHVYPVTVTRSSVFAIVTNRRKRKPVAKRRFVRLFVCPATSQRFQAEISLAAGDDPIERVTVGDPRKPA